MPVNWIELASLSFKTSFLSFRYMSDPDVMAKFGRKFQDIVKEIPAFNTAIEGEAATAADDGAGEEDVADDGTVIGAASNGNAARLRELLQGGEDAAQKDEEGRTALHFAAGYGEIECMQVLLENGADVNAKDNNDNTALHYASGYGVVEAAKVLMEKGADKGIVNVEGKTAGEVAEMNEQEELVKVLAGK
jgi:hypothetical protein